MPAGSPERTRKLLLVAVLGAIFIQLATLSLVKDSIEHGRSDFSGFYSAGRIIVTGHAGQLYDLGTQQAVQRIFATEAGRPSLLPFNHAPFEALIFAPLSLVPYGAAFALWTACSVAMWIGSVFLLRPYLPSLHGYFDMALIAIGCFRPLLFTLIQGQDSILVLFLFTLCLLALLRNREELAGGALALAIIKPQLALPAVLMLALAHRKRGRLLAGFLSTCLMLGALSIAVVGWRACVGYPKALLQYVPDNGVINPVSMPTLRALLNVVLGQHVRPTVLYLCLAGISASLLGAAVANWRAGVGQAEPAPSVAQPSQDLIALHFGLIVTASVLVAFHGYMHDSSLLLLPILAASEWLARMRVNTPNRALLAASIAALFVFPMISVSGQIFCCATLAFFAALWYELFCNRVARGRLYVPRRPAIVKARP